MQNKQPKRNNFISFGTITCLVILLLIINSCHKDEKNIRQIVTRTDISAAKTWYQNAYPVIPGGDKKSAAINSGKTALDLSQFIKPDWDHAVSYNRDNKAIIELPVDAGSSINAALKNIAGNKTYADKANSRSSFLLLKDSTGYKAYVMTVIADADYLKHDLSKLAHNTYNKHDADFSGLVLYFTPQGQYLNGYRYYNGKLISPSSTTEEGQTQAAGSSKQKINKTTVECVDWYLDTYIGDDLVSSQYLYTTCSAIDNSGTGGGSATPPPACTPTGGGIEQAGKQSVNQVTPPLTPVGGDPGFPPPSPVPCVPAVGSGSHIIPDFGEDAPSQCLNCRIKDGNFIDYLDYLQKNGYQIGDPSVQTLVVNGVDYPGELTRIYNSSGDWIASYFTPYTTAGVLEAGTQYRVGLGADGQPVSTPPSNIQAGPPAPEVGAGNTVSITLPAGGAILGNYYQRAALEAADNVRVINLLKQEDAADDAAIGPCNGTGRSGNLRWPGTLEHILIQFDYIANHIGALREYTIPGASGKLNGNPGYADIVNSLTREMFEIKPDNDAGQKAGAAEIQIYVTQANLNCPPMSGGTWRTGSNYPPRYLPDPKNPLNQLEARLNANGVIVYSSKPNDGNRQTVPVVLPETLAERLKKLLKELAVAPQTNQEQLILAFLRANPNIVPYLKSAAAGVIIATIIEDIVTEGAGVADDWESFVIARTLWRAANVVKLY